METAKHRSAERSSGAWTIYARATPQNGSKQNIIDQPLSLVREVEGPPTAGDDFTCRNALDHVEPLLDGAPSRLSSEKKFSSSASRRAARSMAGLSISFLSNVPRFG